MAAPDNRHLARRPKSGSGIGLTDEERVRHCRCGHAGVQAAGLREEGLRRTGDPVTRTNCPITSRRCRRPSSRTRRRSRSRCAAGLTPAAPSIIGRDPDRTASMPAPSWRYRRRHAAVRPAHPGDRFATAHSVAAGFRPCRRGVAALARRCTPDPRPLAREARMSSSSAAASSDWRSPRRSRQPAARSPWSKRSTGCSAGRWRRSSRAMCGNGWKRRACASSPGQRLRGSKAKTAVFRLRCR